ncbi:hypothetical protein [Kitasatospora mediocidica]|uniref:hypothetical protein n=1 Tax=Kitasatospora mediocidica TaxID=58352 RepID=UPI000A92F6C2|nr:hypothetical protein [Kitasatospora mediocidica]
MRPSYDAEHPHSATPIYDELYSEYRRLFRALPGDRAGEEDLRFTGFAVRDRRPSGSTSGSASGRPSSSAYTGAPTGPYPGGYAIEEHRSPYANHGQGQSQPHGNTAAPGSHGYGHAQPSAPAQHQSFPTYAGYPPGAPQFVPAQQQAPHHTQQHPGQGHSTQPHQPAQPSAPSAGQGWVASGYLAATAPAAPPPPAPSASVGASVAGRHRSGLLSLPPGRTPTLS